MTIKQHTKTTCNPFRYLDIWDLEKLFKQAEEMESETKALVLEAMAEKKTKEETYEPLIGRSHSHLVKHVS